MKSEVRSLYEVCTKSAVSDFRLQTSDLQGVRVLTNRDDAAGYDRLDLQCLRAGDERVAFRAGIEPHLPNPLPRHLVDHALADLGLDIERRHVDGARHVQYRGVRFQPLDFQL